MGEQVAGQAGYGWLDGVRADLARESYASRGVDIPACAVDAPHIRQRLYWIACDMDYADNKGLERYAGHGDGRGQWTPKDGSVASTGGSDMADAIDQRRERVGLLWDRGSEVFEASRSGESNMADAQNNGSSFGPHSDTEWSEDKRYRNDDIRCEHIGFGSSLCSDMADANNCGSFTQLLRDHRKMDRTISRKESAGDQSAICFTACSTNSSFWSNAIWLTGSDGKARRSKPGLPLLAHGVSNRVGRLRAYGNAIVPPLAAEVIRAFMETEGEGK
jgi:DNA (cytosine-5)-methyltransferase 1